MKKTVSFRALVSLLVVLSAAGYGIWFLLFRPVDPVPQAPDLLKHALPITAAEAERVYCPLPAPLRITVDRWRAQPAKVEVLIPRSVLPPEISLEAKLEGGRLLRLVRKTAAQRGETEVWKVTLAPLGDSREAPADGFVQRLYFPLSVSPDGRHLLHVIKWYAPVPRARAEVEMLPLDGSGGKRRWTIPLQEQEYFSESPLWLPDNSGWIAWLTRTVPDRRSTRGYRSEYTLLEGQVDSLAVQTVVRVTDHQLYPKIVGVLPDGMTLAVAEGIPAGPDQDIRILEQYSESLSGLAVQAVCYALQVSLQDPPGARKERLGAKLTQAIRIQSKSAGELMLVAFPGTNTEKIARDYRIRLPAHVSSVQLHLAPDGRRVALWCMIEEVLDEVPSWRLDFDRKARPRTLRRGAVRLVIADLETGAQTLMGSYPAGRWQSTSLRWLGWAPDNGSVLVERWRKTRNAWGEYLNEYDPSVASPEHFRIPIGETR